MDVTPQSLRDVRFREKLRGYHTDDVDAFVTRVADLVEQLQRRISELSGGAAPSGGPGHDTTASAGGTSAGEPTEGASAAEVEESLRRTLVLAQRTADLAISEAREEAARIVAESQAERDRLLEDATAERARVEAEIEDLRTRVRTELEQQLRVKEENARSRRAALLADIDALEAHLARERERLRLYFTDQLHKLEEGGPRAEPRPELSAPEPDAPPEAAAGITSAETVEPGDAGGGAGGRPGPGGGAGDAPVDGEPTGQTPGEQPEQPERPEQPEAVDEAVADGAPGEQPDAARGRSPYNALDDEALAASADDDPFLAELRQAVTDTSPLGPRDQQQPAESDDEVDLFRDRGADGGRFGFRRRR